MVWSLKAWQDAHVTIPISDEDEALEYDRASIESNTPGQEASPSAAPREQSGHASVSRHKIAGTILLIFVTLHTIKTKHVFVGPLCGAMTAAAVLLRRRYLSTVVAWGNTNHAQSGVSTFRLVTTTIPSSTKTESSYYFLDGRPVRVAGMIGSEAGFSVTLLTDVVTSTKPVVEGPFPLPGPIYAAWPPRLAIFCGNNGILEAFELFQARKANNLYTDIYWLYQDVTLRNSLKEYGSGASYLSDSYTPLSLREKLRDTVRSCRNMDMTVLMIGEV